MVKFELNNKEYIIPDILSIEDYVKIFKVKDIFSDDYFAAKLLNILTGADIEELLESDYQQINYLASYALTKVPLEKPDFKDRFEIDGIHYGFFPKWEDLSYAEFVDMDTISTKKPEELSDLLHILAAIMFRPIIKERSEHDFDIEPYDLEKMKIRADLFKKKLDVRYVLGAQTFFINFVNRFSLYSQASSIQKLSIWMKMKIMWTMRKWIWKVLFKKRLDGMLSPTELLETILQNTNISTRKK